MNPGKEKEDSKESPIVLIPSSIFKDRKLSVLESMAEYLHEKENMSFHEIAVLLNRNDRTIWTCYKRAKDKHAKK